MLTIKYASTVGVSKYLKFKVNYLLSSILNIYLQKKMRLRFLFLLEYCSKLGCQSLRTQVISYPGHFLPTLVISYLLFGHFVPSNNHFVPRSFRTHFGHFVPRSAGYEMTIW